jgi:hypothetical protein
MSSLTRFLALSALAMLSFVVANGAEAAVIGSALSSFGRSSPAQTVQFGGANCYYAEGWNGRGWYQCGSEWNYGFGWIGPFNLNTFGGAAVRRHHQHTFAVSHPPAANPASSNQPFGCDYVVHGKISWSHICAFLVYLLVW